MSAVWSAQSLTLLIYARKTEGFPCAMPAPGVGSTLTEVEGFLPDLEAKMIEFLAEWVVTLLSPATQIVKTRAPHLAFMFVKEYWFREFYLGLKVAASSQCFLLPHPQGNKRFLRHWHNNPPVFTGRTQLCYDRLVPQ